MADAFFGEIRAFAFLFAPQNWVVCDGSALNVNQYQALYTILGNQFGGTLNQTFNVPNLQGSSVCQAGAGTGLTPRVFAETVGASSVTLDYTQMPNHNHTFNTVTQTQTQAENVPDNLTLLGRTFGQFDYTNTDTFDTTLAMQMIGPAFAGGAHENRQPFLVLNMCICTYGEYPVKAS